MIIYFKKKVFAESNMLPFAFVYLRERFPKWKGWHIRFDYHLERKAGVFILRRKSGYQCNNVIALLIPRSEVCKKDIKLLETFAAESGLMYNAKFKKILIAAQGCKYDVKPKEIDTIYLKEFIY